MNEQMNKSNDEIDLFQYWVIITKRWKLILGLFLVASIAAAGISLYLPKIYRVSALISTGRLKEDVTVAKLADIQQTINSPSFAKSIVPIIKVKGEGNELSETQKISTESVPNSEYILIKYDTTDPENGIKVLDTVIREIQNKYNRRSMNYQKAKEAQIDQLKRTVNTLQLQQNKSELEIQKLKVTIEQKERTSQIEVNLAKFDKQIASDQIKRLKERIKTITSSRDKLKEMSAAMEQNTKDLLAEKTVLSRQQEKDRTISSILLSSDLQQSINSMSMDNERIKIYETDINDAQNQIDNLSTQLKSYDEKMKKIEMTKDQEIKNLNLMIQTQGILKDKEIPLEIEKVNSQIEGLEAEKNMIEGIETVAAPDFLPDPIKPKKTIITLLASLAGLFFGIILSFAFEWHQVNTNRTQNFHDEKLTPSKLGA